MRPETKVGIVAKWTCYVSGPVLGLLEWGEWDDRGVGTVECKGDSGRAAGSVLGDRGVERMVGIERDGREGRGNSRLENGRAWQFKSHGVEGIGISSPTAQTVRSPADPSQRCIPREGLPGSQNPASSGMARRPARGLGSLFSHWRRRGYRW